MKKSRRFLLWFIVALTLSSVWIDLPRSFRLINKEFFLSEININFGKIQLQRNLEIKKAIDLNGGTHLVFQADMTGVDQKDRDSAIAAASENIKRRVNLYGVTEASVQTSKLKDEYRLIVELPVTEDVDQTLDLIGKTARLDFRELEKGASQAAALGDFKTAGLTGKDLTRSQVQFDPNTGQPVVGLEFSKEGEKKFAEITERNVGKPLAIFLDELPVTIPMVKEKINSPNAIITGEFTLDQAKKLSAQLNAGALPVPIKIIEQKSIGATLGAESIGKSVRAGLIGLFIVVFFMGAYYGRLGLLADIGLIVYGLLTLAIYKLIPVTLSLPGVAGFLLSVGMAVDSNILIFERMKEEIRIGKPRQLAMELGFGRAWDSIRDANICTLITCFILFNPFEWSFLNTSGMIRGFALTLALGVVLSLFTGIVVTRTILRVFSQKGES